MTRLMELIMDLDSAELHAQERHRAIVAQMALQRYLLLDEEDDLLDLEMDLAFSAI